MKNIVNLVLSLFIIQCTFSQYYTPGTGVHWDLNDLVVNSGGVITNEEESYLIWDDLIISLNDTLSVLSDELIRIGQGVEINVFGTFISNPIWSTTIVAMDTTAGFKGIRFDNSDGSTLKKTKIEYGGGIKLIDSNVIFDECIIRKNNQANSSGTIDMINSNPVIQNSLIRDNSGPAVLSAANGNSSPQITDNVIVHNCSANQNMPQINLGTSSSIDTIRIINNMITGWFDNSGGIAVATLAGGEIRAIIEGNTIENNRYGITAYGMNVFTLIKNNLIINNNIQGDPMLGGSGINFWGNQTNVSIVTGNEIAGNLWGITVQYQAMPNLGQVEPFTVSPGYNMIYNNENNGEVYALYNNTPNDLYAENNYWGTFDPDSVEMFIYHQPDDPTLGIVDYLPIKDFFTTIHKQKNDLSPSLKLFPNPVETDIFPQFHHHGVISFRYNFQILDLHGRVLSSGYIYDPEKGVDVSFLPDGLYFFLLKTESKIMTTKFIKQ